jgi:hypothetical protein
MSQQWPEDIKKRQVSMRAAAERPSREDLGPVAEVEMSAAKRKQRRKQADDKKSVWLPVHKVMHGGHSAQARCDHSAACSTRTRLVPYIDAFL